MGAELSDGNWHTGRGQGPVQVLPDALGVSGLSGRHEAGTIAATQIRIEGELGDGEDGAAAVQDRPVHPTLFVGEDAHPGQLADGIVHLGIAVAVLDGHQKQEPRADALGFKIRIRLPLLVDHIDPGMADLLYDDSHGSSLNTLGVVVVQQGKAGPAPGEGRTGEPFEDWHEGRPLQCSHGRAGSCQWFSRWLSLQLLRCLASGRSPRCLCCQGKMTCCLFGAILIGVHGGCHEELPTYSADGRILASHGFPWIVSGSLAPLDYADVSVN